jgi:hypothetical protein
MAEAPSVALADLQKQVVRMRDKEEKPWHEIAGETGESAGKCMLAYEMAHLPASEKVTAKTDAAMAKEIVRLRDKQGLSWGSIVARTDIPESRLRSIYEATTGQSTKGNRIGKGGRHPGDGGGGGGRKATGATKKVRAPKKAPAKKAPAAKKATKKAAPVKKAAKKASGSRKAAGGAAPTSLADHPLTELDYDDLAARLEGRAIVVAGANGKDRNFKVRAVRSLDNGNVEFSDAGTGNVHTVKVDSIRRIGAVLK